MVANAASETRRRRAVERLALEKPILCEAILTHLMVGHWMCATASHPGHGEAATVHLDRRARVSPGTPGQLDRRGPLGGGTGNSCPTRQHWLSLTAPASGCGHVDGPSARPQAHSRATARSHQGCVSARLIIARPHPNRATRRKPRAALRLVRQRAPLRPRRDRRAAACESYDHNSRVRSDEMRGRGGIQC